MSYWRSWVSKYTHVSLFQQIPSICPANKPISTQIPPSPIHSFTFDFAFLLFFLLEFPYSFLLLLFFPGQKHNSTQENPKYEESPSKCYLPRRGPGEEGFWYRGPLNLIKNITMQSYPIPVPKYPLLTPILSPKWATLTWDRNGFHLLLFKEGILHGAGHLFLNCLSQ